MTEARRANWTHLLGEDPATWDPRFVDWPNLQPEKNDTHSLFLAAHYVREGFVDEEGRWCGLPEWLARAFCALSSWRLLDEFEKELREKGLAAAQRLYRGEK